MTFTMEDPDGVTGISQFRWKMVIMANIGALTNMIIVPCIQKQNQMVGGRVHLRYQIVNGAIHAPALALNAEVLQLHRSLSNVSKVNFSWLGS